MATKQRQRAILKAPKQNKEKQFNFTPTFSKDDFKSISGSITESNSTNPDIKEKRNPFENRSIRSAIQEHNMVLVDELLHDNANDSSFSWMKELNDSLVVAVTKKQPKLVEKLIKAGATEHIKERPYPLIYLALDMKEIEIFNLMLQDGLQRSGFETLIAQPCSTLLHSAVRSGCLETVKMVVGLFKNNEIAMDMKDSNGDTPLHLSITCVHMIKKTQTWFSTENTLKARAKRKKLGIKRPFNDPSRICSDVYGKRNNTAFSHNAAITQWLLASGENVGINEVNNQNRTPLHVAVMLGIEDRVGLLLEHGADPSIMDLTGFQPWMYAAELNKKDILTELSEKCDPEIFAKSYRGKSILHHACALGCLESVKVLVKKGLDSSALSSAGWTPLMEAASKLHIECMNYLLDNTQCDINYFCHNKSALILLLQNFSRMSENELKILDRLSKDGLNLEIKDANKNTPLISLLSNDKARQWLLEKGADVNVHTKDGKSLIWLACEKNESLAVKLLQELMEYNINMQMTDEINNDIGETPLVLALKTDCKYVCQLFLDSGCPCQNTKSWLESENGKDYLRNVPDKMVTIVQRIQSQMIQPTSLVDASRLVILSSFKQGKLSPKIEKLCLPKLLISFLKWPIFCQWKRDLHK